MMEMQKTLTFDWLLALPTVAYKQASTRGRMSIAYAPQYYPALFFSLSNLDGAAIHDYAIVLNSLVINQEVNHWLKAAVVMSRDQAVTPKFLESDKQPKLRSACDGCHAAKIRCTGGTPCARCARENLRCHYSFKAKIGKPKGSLNKKTIERMQQMAKPARNNQRAPPSEATAPRSETLATIPYAANNLLLSPVSGESTSADVVLLPQNSHEIQETISSKPLALGHSDNLVYEGDDLDGMENWHSMVAASSIEMESTQTTSHSTDQDPDSSRTTNKIPIGYEDDSSFWRNTTFSQISGAIDPSFSQLSPYSSKSTPSGQIDRQCSNHASILSPYAGPSPPHTHPSSPCTCFAMLSSRLCELQALSIATEQARAIDSLLVQSQTTIPYIKTLFKCHNCMRDTQGLLMATMVLSRLLTWTRLSLIDQELGLISAQVRLGKFTGSRELGIMVTRLLLRTHWLDLKRTVEHFQDRVDQIGYDKADRSYLATQAENFRLELKQFSEKVPDVSRLSFLMAV